MVKHKLLNLLVAGTIASSLCLGPVLSYANKPTVTEYTTYVTKDDILTSQDGKGGTINPDKELLAEKPGKEYRYSIRMGYYNVYRDKNGNLKYLYTNDDYGKERVEKELKKKYPLHPGYIRYLNPVTRIHKMITVPERHGEAKVFKDPMFKNLDKHYINLNTKITIFTPNGVQYIGDPQSGAQLSAEATKRIFASTKLPNGAWSANVALKKASTQGEEDLDILGSANGTSVSGASADFFTYAVVNKSKSEQDRELKTFERELTKKEKDEFKEHPSDKENTITLKSIKWEGPDSKKLLHKRKTYLHFMTSITPFNESLKTENRKPATLPASGHTPRIDNALNLGRHMDFYGTLRKDYPMESICDDPLLAHLTVKGFQSMERVLSGRINGSGSKSKFLNKYPKNREEVEENIEKISKEKNLNKNLSYDIFKELVGDPLKDIEDDQSNPVNTHRAACRSIQEAVGQMTSNLMYGDHSKSKNFNTMSINEKIQILKEFNDLLSLSMASYANAQTSIDFDTLGKEAQDAYWKFYKFRTQFTPDTYTLAQYFKEGVMPSTWRLQAATPEDRMQTKNNKIKNSLKYIGILKEHAKSKYQRPNSSTELSIEELDRMQFELEKALKESGKTLDNAESISDADIQQAQDRFKSMLNPGSSGEEYTLNASSINNFFRTHFNLSSVIDETNNRVIKDPNDILRAIKNSTATKPIETMQAELIRQALSQANNIYPSEQRPSSLYEVSSGTLEKRTIAGKEILVGKRLVRDGSGHKQLMIGVCGTVSDTGVTLTNPNSATCSNPNYYSEDYVHQVLALSGQTDIANKLSSAPRALASDSQIYTTPQQGLTPLPSNYRPAIVHRAVTLNKERTDSVIEKAKNYTLKPTSDENIDDFMKAGPYNLRTLETKLFYLERIRKIERYHSGEYDGKDLTKEEKDPKQGLRYVYKKMAGTIDAYDRVLKANGIDIDKEIAKNIKLLPNKENEDAVMYRVYVPHIIRIEYDKPYDIVASPIKGTVELTPTHLKVKLKEFKYCGKLATLKLPPVDKDAKGNKATDGGTSWASIALSTLDGRIYHDVKSGKDLAFPNLHNYVHNDKKEYCVENLNDIPNIEIPRTDTQQTFNLTYVINNNKDDITNKVKDEEKRIYKKEDKYANNKATLRIVVPKIKRPDLIARIPKVPKDVPPLSPGVPSMNVCVESNGYGKNMTVAVPTNHKLTITPDGADSPILTQAFNNITVPQNGTTPNLRACGQLPPGKYQACYEINPNHKDIEYSADYKGKEETYENNKACDSFEIPKEPDKPQPPPPNIQPPPQSPPAGCGAYTLRKLYNGTRKRFNANTSQVVPVKIPWMSNIHSAGMITRFTASKTALIPESTYELQDYPYAYSWWNSLQTPRENKGDPNITSKHLRPGGWNGTINGISYYQDPDRPHAQLMRLVKTGSQGGISCGGCHDWSKASNVSVAGNTFYNDCQSEETRTETICCGGYNKKGGCAGGEVTCSYRYCLEWLYAVNYPTEMNVVYNAWIKQEPFVNPGPKFRVYDDMNKLIVDGSVKAGYGVKVANRTIYATDWEYNIQPRAFIVRPEKEQSLYGNVNINPNFTDWAYTEGRDGIGIKNGSVNMAYTGAIPGAFGYSGNRLYGDNKPGFNRLVNLKSILQDSAVNYKTQFAEPLHINYEEPAGNYGTLRHPQLREGSFSQQSDVQEMKNQGIAGAIWSGGKGSTLGKDDYSATNVYKGQPVPKHIVYAKYAHPKYEIESWSNLIFSGGNGSSNWEVYDCENADLKVKGNLWDDSYVVPSDEKRPTDGKGRQLGTDEYNNRGGHKDESSISDQHKWGNN